MEKELVNRLESAVSRLEGLVAGSHPSISSRDFSDGSADPSISAFSDLIENSLGKLITTAEKIGGKVLEVTKIVEEAFLVEKNLLTKIKKYQKPDVASLAEFLKPLNEITIKANYLTEGKRSDFFNHLKAASDSLAALAWIAYTGKDCGMSLPIAHVEESWHTAEFYNNKILVEYKNKDPDHTEWAKSLKELYLPGLKEYVKAFYPLGPAWGPVGSPTIFQSTSRSSNGNCAAQVPFAPPLPSTCIYTSKTALSLPNNRTFVPRRPPKPQPIIDGPDLLQEISSFNPAAGLRKVTDEMKTKNRVDRTGVVGTTEQESHSNTFSASKTSPPKFELQMGRKWVVENHIGNKDLVITDCDSKQSVYVFGCRDSVLQIKGKVNNITLDKCTKTGVVFKDVVAACEVVNCNRVEVQCEGSAPTVSIDNTGECQVYLSNESLDTSITTAKSSEINVLTHGGGPEGDWVEHALPQQFVHSYKDGQFLTSPLSHSGG